MASYVANMEAALADVDEQFELTDYGHGVRMWVPSGDVLHEDAIEAQDPGCIEVLQGKPFGPCGGVAMAIRVVRQLAEDTGGNLSLQHAPTHGADDTAEMIRLGATIQPDPEKVDSGSTYVFSAHGVAPAVRRTAHERGLRISDATCPLVERTHRAIAEAGALAEKLGARVTVGYISLGSSPTHAERVGAAGVAEDFGKEAVRFMPVTGETDIDELVRTTNDEEAIVVVGQTTNNSDEALRLTNLIVERGAANKNQVVRPKTGHVCNTVRDRQASTRDIIRLGAEQLVVVGSVKSKNTLSLGKVAAEEARRMSEELQYARELGIVVVNSWRQLPVLEGVVGVVSGASTRIENVTGIIERLAPQTITKVGEDSDGAKSFQPVDAATRALLKRAS